MKKITGFIAALCLSLSMVACSSQSGAEVTTVQTSEQTSSVTQEQQNNTVAADVNSEASEESADVNAETNIQTDEVQSDSIQNEEEGNKTLVAYFSCTGNTRGLAEKIASALDADIYEIVPEQPYTDADLDYGDSSSRSTKEQNDDSCRPAISGSVDNMDGYDTIVIGYPIWWGQAPKIIYTFVESYDLSGKTIIPFCTSASSGVGSSASNLEDSAGSANWLDGTRLSSSDSESDIEDWLGKMGVK